MEIDITRRRPVDPYANGIAWMIDAPHRRNEARDRAHRLALRETNRPGVGDRIRNLLAGSARDTAPVACCSNPSAA
jgi:hypothetical protein